MTHRIYDMTFASVYPLYVKKVERKGQSEADLKTVITWLTGYSETELQNLIDREVTFREFFAGVRLNDNAEKITGIICGVRIEEIEDPLMKQIRYLDKVVDELAGGKKLEKIFRS